MNLMLEALRRRRGRSLDRFRNDLDDSKKEVKNTILGEGVKDDTLLGAGNKSTDELLASEKELNRGKYGEEVQAESGQVSEEAEAGKEVKPELDKVLGRKPFSNTKKMSDGEESEMSELDEDIYDDSMVNQLEKTGKKRTGLFEKVQLNLSKKKKKKQIGG